MGATSEAAVFSCISYEEGINEQRRHCLAFIKQTMFL